MDAPDGSLPDSWSFMETKIMCLSYWLSCLIILVLWPWYLSKADKFDPSLEAWYFLEAKRKEKDKGRPLINHKTSLTPTLQPSDMPHANPTAAFLHSVSWEFGSCFCNLDTGNALSIEFVLSSGRNLQMYDDQRDAIEKAFNVLVRLGPGLIIC